MYQKLDFGPDAKAFLRLQLSTQSGLWQMLCELPLEMGRMFGFLPPTATTRQLIHFAWALNRREDLEQDKVDWEYRQLERDFIADFVMQKSDRMALFYGDTIPPGKNVPQSSGPVRIYYRTLRFPNAYSADVPTRTEIYYMLNADMTRKDIDQVIKNNVSRMPLIAALTSSPPNFEGFREDRQLDESVLRVLAARTESIVVSAFDFDANLIWTRT
jgi:hypothetical protein